MKKLFFVLAFIAAFLTSCLTEQTVNYEGKGAVNITLGIDIPELSTRAGETGMNSGLGAIDNFSDDEWAQYDLRYIFEVYDVTENYEDLDNPIKQRLVKTYNTYEPTSFELRLIPNRKYKFVVWADFVAEGTTTDLNYNTAKLSNISRLGYVAPMKEAQDAYFVQKDIFVESTINESLTLTRPFGKIRVIATDIDEVNLNSTPSRVEAKFYNHPTFFSLNALTGEAENEIKEVTYAYTIEKGKPYSTGYDAEACNQTLFADYIFAQPAADGAQEVNFTMTIYDQNDRVIREHDFNTQIPLKRNRLTTLVGNILTTTTEFNITIDDTFTDSYDINPEAPLLAAPEVSASVDGNVVTLSWAEVEGAEYYTVAYNDVTEKVEDTTVEFTLDYETEYTFAVKACTDDLMAYKPSEATIVSVTTEVQVIKLETPVVATEVVEYNKVVFNWDDIANANYYTITYNETTTVVTERSVTLELEYNTTYLFAIQAHSNDTAHYLPSDIATVEVTTEAEPVKEYIYLKPNSNWVVDNARFAVYTWIEGGEVKWYDMVDSDDDGIYEVEKSLLHNNIIFCRMSPNTSNNWDNRWNQTSNLTLPSDGNNLYTIEAGSWDNGNGTWSVFGVESEPEPEPVLVTATLTFDNTAKRTTFTSSQQVWEENDITLTNDKASSTNAVADYAKPARFYQGSKITVSAPGEITTIVFDCNSSSYATVLKNSIGSTATVSSDKVTVEVSGDESFVVAKLTAQVRMDAITVTYWE